MLGDELGAGREGFWGGDGCEGGVRCFYGYDNSYYNGLLGMAPFIDQYSDGPAGAKALSVTFTSLTSSSIYIGDLFGAHLSAPINDFFGRKWVFFVAVICILAGGIAQIADRWTSSSSAVSSSALAWVNSPSHRFCTSARSLPLRFEDPPS
jgi:hypothetical protein